MRFPDRECCDSESQPCHGFTQLGRLAGVQTQICIQLHRAGAVPSGLAWPVATMISQRSSVQDADRMRIVESNDAGSSVRKFP